MVYYKFLYISFKKFSNEKQEGVNISMKKTTLLISVVLMFFILLGAVSATELNNVTNTKDSTLVVDNEKLSLTNLDESNLKISSDDVQNESLTTSFTNTQESSLQNLQASAENSTDTNTTKLSTSIAVGKSPHYSKTGTIIKVTLKDNNTNPIENKYVTLKYNGKNYKSSTDNDGIAYFNLTSLKVGTSISVTAKFNGNSQYYKSSTTKKLKIQSSIKANDLVETYGDKKAFAATFYKDNGYLKNTNVTFKVNGKTYKVKTDSSGNAKITPSLSPGTYTIKIYNPYSKETISKKITVKKANTKITGSNAYALPKSKIKYSVVLKNNKNKAIKNVTITFKYNNKQLTGITNANGKATVKLPGLSKGTYKISYQYKGNKNYNGASGSSKVYVKDSTVTLIAKDLKMQYNDNSKYQLTVKDTATGKLLANKTIKFTLNGTTTSVTTDKNGIAALRIGDLVPNTYAIKATHSKSGKKDYNIHNGKVIISKQNVTIIANDLVMKVNTASNYQVTVKNKTGSPIKDVEVKFTLNKKTTKVKTDAKGIAKLAVNEKMGNYEINITAGNELYTSSKITRHILVNGTKFIASDMTISPNSQAQFQVKVLDTLNKPVRTTIKFTLNNNVQSVKTDAEGIAKLSIPKLSKGTYTVTYTDGTTTGSSKINVVDKIKLNDIITASKNVKKYIENNGELPATVTIGTTTYSLANYVYLASQAIINLKNNNKNDIDIVQVKDPANPQEAANLGELFNYLSVAKDVVNTCNSKGIMPDSVNSERGVIGYKGWVYAAARVVAFYGDEGIMPNYVTIKTYTTSTSSPLNSKNTIKDLTPYRKATTNCQVGNSQIKSVVASLTSGLTSDLAKAKAIYNYVRDAVSYSFYYDTRYGAVGTLNAKTGNCVDQAHLLIAMYRTAGLAARYVHGTCVFSSGSTYGHVWAQVLIGDTWIVSDPTSTRNSFGNVVNWNNYNYALHGYYAGIDF